MMESINKDIKNKGLKILGKDIRVRFAPSPTGFFHIGSARTALFNYFFAQKNNGSFILRIEDTDKERSKKIYENDILEGMKWLGINWDEGPDNYKNIFGPYRQSERGEIYKKYMEKILDQNHAYYCFCSPEELEAQKQYQQSRGETSRYNKKCANLTKNEIDKNIAEGKRSVIRLRSFSKKIKFKDSIRGEIEFSSEEVGDMVIAKNLNNPLYNFAVVIDDFEMKITHVIRGEDHISNTPKQILVAEALDIPIPEYAHFPMILAPDKSKLSKRHGAVAITDYRDDGYLAEAIINFIAFMGWNPGTENEIYSMESLIKNFSLEKVQKSGAIFNIKKLDFINGIYIRKKPIKELTEMCIPYLLKSELIIKKDNNYFLKDGEKITYNSIENIISIHQDRLKKLSEISDFADFFFQKEIKYDKELLRWKTMTDNEIVISLDNSEKILSNIDNAKWNKEILEKVLMNESEKTGDRGILLWPLRVALSGKKASVGPFEIAFILGKEKIINRIQEAKKIF